MKDFSTKNVLTFPNLQKKSLIEKNHAKIISLLSTRCVAFEQQRNLLKWKLTFPFPQ